MISLRKLPQCFSCRYHDQTGHLVCAVHPSGPSGDRCADFEEIPAVVEHGAWNPEGWAFEGGELLKTAASYLPQYDASHPIVTGLCPKCGNDYDQGNTPLVHWDCGECGWMDDSV